MIYVILVVGFRGLVKKKKKTDEKKYPAKKKVPNGKKLFTASRFLVLVIYILCTRIFTALILALFLNAIFLGHGIFKKKGTEVFSFCTR